MVVGYRYFLRRIAEMLDAQENLTLNTMADRLNLRHGEFRDILNIMIKKGDIECVEERSPSSCTGNCPGCSKLCLLPELTGKTISVKSYILTAKGKMTLERITGT